MKRYVDVPICFSISIRIREWKRTSTAWVVGVLKSLGIELCNFLYALFESRCPFLRNGFDSNSYKFCVRGYLIEMAVLEQALLEECFFQHTCSNYVSVSYYHCSANLDLISLAGRISLHRGRPAQIKKGAKPRLAPRTMHKLEVIHIRHRTHK